MAASWEGSFLRRWASVWAALRFEAEEDLARVWRARKRAMRSAMLVVGGCGVFAAGAEEDEEAAAVEASGSGSSSFASEALGDSDCGAGSPGAVGSAMAGSCAEGDADSTGSEGWVSEGGGEDAVAVTTWSFFLPFALAAVFLFFAGGMIGSGR